MTKEFKLAFFGSSEFSVFVLEELENQNIIPDLVVTGPDQPTGRKLVLTPNPCKEWALKNKIPILEPQNLRNALVQEKLKEIEWDLFLVASYGKIIPKEIFNIPVRKTLNIHPSLLPKYRGASPIVSQILEDEKEIGVSIMQIEDGVDTGPIVAQKKMEVRVGEVTKDELEKVLAEEGTKLFVEILPKWLSGYLQPTPQDESLATLSKKIKKEDGLINLEDDPRKNLLKVKAYQGWPTTYFFVEKNNKQMRVIITEAELQEGQFKILRVKPEGKKEMPYQDFLRGLKNK